MTCIFRTPEGILIRANRPIQKDVIKCLCMELYETISLKTPGRESQSLHASRIRQSLCHLVRRRDLPFRFEVYQDEGRRVTVRKIPIDKEEEPVIQEEEEDIDHVEEEG